MANTYPTEPRNRGTGPQGHRARMRARVLNNGAETLADYELLEMLLFLGIPRRDTKPIAKGLLAQYGSLINVFRAPTSALRASGLNDASIRALRLPAIGAERLAQAEPRHLITLGDWAQLSTYLTSATQGAVHNQFRILYLDNRNRLLADEVAPDDPDMTARHRGIFRRALTLHATALIGLFVHPADKDTVLNTIAKNLDSSAQCLSITVHDILITDHNPAPRSMRQEGRF
ncbi:JAB domain-containing protein [Neokomagataea thailandica]|uniref:DNA repair protein RadC n=1 Tax=Neokomagataea tanensis NBRC 106556 TaxID=1223519 RepID=A0ABQ0QK83_9PROT|nr:MULTISPECIES: JAB domain-containing protein [Neokomagataea]GBR47694.1 DNA repair protein RadC [Neokomagataea tanensis NBRC 106556]